MTFDPLHGDHLRVLLFRQADGGKPGLPVLPPQGVVRKIVGLHQQSTPAFLLLQPKAVGDGLPIIRSSLNEKSTAGVVKKLLQNGLDEFE